MPVDQLLAEQIKKLPLSPGVYIFKDSGGTIVYIGKAKSLKKRVSSYLQRQGHDMRVDAILGASSSVDYQETSHEIEAMILEARLIQMHQPKCNILLKHGQPFLYLLITSGEIPELKLVRSKKERGTYFGPFLEKGSARKVYDFLLKTFTLYRCGKKVEQGCLYFHMGFCAGFCRSDVNADTYKKHIELARTALKQGHASFLDYLKEQIVLSNKSQLFEQSRQLHGYLKAFESVFGTLDVKPSAREHLFLRDIWVYEPNHGVLMLFSEQRGALKRKQIFYDFSQAATLMDNNADLRSEYMASYYRITTPPATILTNYELDCSLFEQFLIAWHALNYPVHIVVSPEHGHEASLVRLALHHSDKEVTKRILLPQLLQQMFLLPLAPKTIDCFDISHKQGRFMVGSCVRFNEGQPDMQGCRKFYINEVEGIDDYAALREVVTRRYRDPSELPDLVLIDGGKGQLNAVKALLPLGRCISLAKREERIFSEQFPEGKLLDNKTFVGQVLMALRDYAHYFALSFHRDTERKNADR